MVRKVITTGGSAVDIDAYACAIGLGELYSLLKVNHNVIIGPLNHSLTPKLLALPTTFDKSHIQEPDDNFILIDFSEPDFIPKFITDQSKIVEIYDHHFGYENYWREKIGKNAHIEKVGACATLIWEEFKKAGLQGDISKVSADLLYTAIASNTLNFKASVTDKRDIVAFEKLKKYVDLPENWIETYFRDQEASVYQNVEKAIVGDTKTVNYSNLPFSLTIGQLELWDSKEFFDKHILAAEIGIASFNNPNWFLTSPSISEGKNYLFAKDKGVKELLGKVLGVKFDGDLAQTNKLILRKEILKKLQAV